MKRAEILSVVKEYFEASQIPFSEDLLVGPIFDSGLDSLDFAALVAKLEIEFAFDPFADSEVAIYPATLEEFISQYVNFVK